MRPVRRAAALLIAVFLSVAATAVTDSIASAAGAQCGSQVETRQPVLLVHGYNSGPQTWSAATRSSYAQVAGTCLDVFDYAKWSTQWVTDPHVGPALAARLQQLGQASAAGHGSGKVIVVAHSMGGLAVRCAVDAGCNGGLAGIAGRVRELITFGTPNTGTWLRGHGPQYAALSSQASLLSAACYGSFNGANPICEQVRALGTSSATKAFTPDSDQLRALAVMPHGIPVYAVAAQIQLVTTVFSWASVDLADVGDLIVKEDSALAEGVRYGELGGVQTIDCGTFSVIGFTGNSCWHSTETNDTRFLGAAIAQIRLAAQPAPPTSPATQPPTTPPVVVTTPPATRTAAPSTTPPPADGTFTAGSPFDDYCVVNWPTAPQYTSTSIAMIMGCSHVPQSRFLYTQVVYGDPALPVTPSTGRMHVVGTVQDTARSGYGYNVLQVRASKISW